MAPIFAEGMEVEVFSRSNDREACGWWCADIKVRNFNVSSLSFEAHLFYNSVCYIAYAFRNRTNTLLWHCDINFYSRNM